jgi:DNA-binding MarR family transcriptional regulator
MKGGSGNSRSKGARANRTNRKIDFDLLPGLVGYQLRRAQLSVFGNFADVVGAHNVTPGQFGVLVLIDANRGLNQSELGKAMGVDRSTVVAVIDRLESAGLVVREAAPNDRRSYALKLSDAGDSLLRTLRPLVRAHEDAVAADLSGEERDLLIDLLRRLTSGATRMGD